MPVRVLLTNDDGFRAGGILAVRAALADRFEHVITIAPESDCSGFAHRCTFSRPVAVTCVTGGRHPVYRCDGTPADCVRAGLLGGLADQADLVVSGINHGANLINTAGDQYASMPSLHVAWAVWCALALYPVVRPWALRVLVVAYPLMTALVVVATGNHFFLDAVAGAVLACLTWAVVSRLSRPRGGPGPHFGDHDGDVDNNLEACLQMSCSGSAARTG